MVLSLIINGSNAGAIKALSGVSAAAKTTGGALGNLDQSAGLQNTSRALDNVAARLNQVRTAALAVAGGMVGAGGIADLVRLSDEYTSVNARMKLASSSSEDFARAQAGVFEIAQRNGRELAATATLFGRIAGPMRDMGKSTEDTLTIVDAVAASLRIAGATAAESSSAQIQFSQALAAGRLQGEELNTVLEASPPLAKALATAMRVSVGDLKAMGAEGKLTGKIIAEALLSQAESLKTRASQMESAIGEALTRVRNAFQQTFGSSTTAGAAKIAAGIDAVAANMRVLVEVSAVAAAGLAAVFGTRMLTSIAANLAARAALVAAEREAAATALATAQANVRAAQAEAARTLSTKALAAAQAQLAVAERAAAVASAGVATRAGGALLGFLGGPIGAIVTAITLGITAWQLWGTKSKEAIGEASVSIDELIKEMREFGDNASVEEQTKRYNALAEAIKKAREEEVKRREEARKKTDSDLNIGTKAQADAAVDNDPQVKEAAAKRIKLENELQAELKRINESAANERLFIAKSLLDKQKAMNGELVVDERKALAARLTDNLNAAAAVRDAWLNTLNEIKAKRAEAEAAPGKARDKAVGLKDRTDNVKMSGMSEEDKANYQAQQAMDAREGALADTIRGRFELMKAYSQQLRGDFTAAKASFDAAEKDLNRAFDQAERAGDAGQMDEIAAKLVDIEKQRGKVAEGEAKNLEQQADAQRSKMAELEGAAETLKNTLSGLEVQVTIDAAMERLSTLEAKAQSVRAAINAAQGGSGPEILDLSPYGPGDPGAVPARAYGGPLPGYASNDRADNMIYRGTPGEWVIQRPAVSRGVV
jgi:tape measure domain-containing protein